MSNKSIPVNSFAVQRRSLAARFYKSSTVECELAAKWFGVTPMQMAYAFADDFMLDEGIEFPPDWVFSKTVKELRLHLDEMGCDSSNWPSPAIH